MVYWCWVGLEMGRTEQMDKGSVDMCAILSLIPSNIRLTIRESIDVSYAKILLY